MFKAFLIVMYLFISAFGTSIPFFIGMDNHNGYMFILSFIGFLFLIHCGTVFMKYLNGDYGN